MGGSFDGLTVLGAPVTTPSANERIALADWGYVLLLEQGSNPAPSYSGFVTALDVHLTRDHGGLPAGSEILVGRAQASAEVAAPPPPPKHHAAGTPAKAPDELPLIPPAYRTIPKITPPLREQGYIFPVWGPSGFSDTFGAVRTPTWHHGDDIFARVRHAPARGRERHRLLGRLEQSRRLPALARRRQGQRVLLRAPLRLRAGRGGRRRGQGRHRARLRGQHG